MKLCFHRIDHSIVYAEAPLRQNQPDEPDENFIPILLYKRAAAPMSNPATAPPTLTPVGAAAPGEPVVEEVAEPNALLTSLPTDAVALVMAALMLLPNELAAGPPLLIKLEASD